MKITCKLMALVLLGIGTFMLSCADQNAKKASSKRVSGTDCTKNKKAAQSESLMLAGIQTTQLSQSELEQACNSIADYQCEQRVFRPGVKDGQSQTQSCINGDKDCINLVVRSFDTNVARRDDNEADFAIGGAYNYVEFNCYHQSFKNQQGFPIQGSSDQLAKAVSTAQDQCHAAIKIGGTP